VDCLNFCQTRFGDFPVWGVAGQHDSPQRIDLVRPGFDCVPAVGNDVLHEIKSSLILQRLRR
jgi:hypothetical protein